MKRRVALRSLLGVVVLVASAGAASAADFKVVVNSGNAIASLTSAELGQIFLKKNTRWVNGSAIEPVDQGGASAIRADFSQKAHGKSVSAVKSYWQRQIYSGRGTPPPELSSDAEVIAYVRSHPGAIGYVADGTAPGDGIKVAKLTD